MAGALIKAAQKRIAAQKAGGKVRQQINPMAKEGGNKVLKTIRTAVKRRAAGMK